MNPSKANKQFFNGLKFFSMPAALPAGEKPWLVGKPIQTAYRICAPAVATQTLEIHRIYPEYKIFIDVKFIIGKFKTVFFDLFNCRDESRIVFEKPINDAGLIYYGATAWTANFTNIRDLQKIVSLKVERLKAFSANKAGIIRKHSLTPGRRLDRSNESDFGKAGSFFTSGALFKRALIVTFSRCFVNGK